MKLYRYMTKEEVNDLLTTGQHKDTYEMYFLPEVIKSAEIGPSFGINALALIEERGPTHIDVSTFEEFRPNLNNVDFSLINGNEKDYLAEFIVSDESLNRLIEDRQIRFQAVKLDGNERLLSVAMIGVKDYSLEHFNLSQISLVDKDLNEVSEVNLSGIKRNDLDNTPLTKEEGVERLKEMMDYKFHCTDEKREAGKAFGDINDLSWQSAVMNKMNSLEREEGENHKDFAMRCAEAAREELDLKEIETLVEGVEESVEKDTKVVEDDIDLEL